MRNYAGSAILALLPLLVTGCADNSATLKKAIEEKQAAEEKAIDAEKRAIVAEKALAEFNTQAVLAQGGGDGEGSARIWVTGQVESFATILNTEVRLDGKSGSAEKKSNEAHALFLRLDKTRLVVMLPDPKAYPGLDVTRLIEKTVAVRGRLAGGQAKRPMMVGEAVTIVDDKNQAQFPPKGSARVEGEAALALKCGPTLIVVTGKRISKVQEVEGSIRVTGKLTLSDKGTALLEAKEIERVKK
jgi:hypothetical protein